MLPKRLPTGILVGALVGAVVFIYFEPANHQPIWWFVQFASVLLIAQMVWNRMSETLKVLFVAFVLIATVVEIALISLGGS